LQVDAS